MVVAGRSNQSESLLRESTETRYTKFPSFSDDIARLHVKLSDLNTRKARLEKVLQEKYGNTILAAECSAIDKSYRCLVSNFEIITLLGFACPFS
jgi:hypothetical protein